MQTREQLQQLPDLHHDTEGGKKKKEKKHKRNATKGMQDDFKNRMPEVGH